MEQYNLVPDELKKLKRWMLWNYNEKKTKIPLRLGGDAGSSTDPNCWCAFDIAVDTSIYYQGIAFAIGEPYTGIDLDNCFDDSGNLRQWAWPIVARLDGVSYAEISPSGNGIKFITKARKPDGSKCVHKFSETKDKQQLECYDSGRFWTITGDVYNGQTEIGDGQSAIDWICKEYLSTSNREKKGTKKHDPVPPRADVVTLYRRAESYVESVPGESKGNLRNAAFKLAGHLHALIDDLGGRLSDDEVYSLLCGWNTRNNPPLRDDELKEASVNGRKNGTPREDKPATLIQSVYSEVDLSAILNTREAVKIDLGPFPIDCNSLPGFLGDVVRYNLKTAHYPLPELAMAAALALLSTITGGKVSDRGARTNLLIISLALSGAGKDHGRKLNRKILRLCGGGRMLGPERIGSHAGILSALAEQWNMMFQVDEIHHLAMAMQSQSAPHLVQISSVLMQVFSSADDVWVGDAYGDRSKVKTLEYPHLVLHGTAVPKDFWEAMTVKNLTGGLIGRCLVFEAPEYVDYQDPSDDPIPQTIGDQAAWWLQLRTVAGNLADMSDGSTPIKIKRDEVAHKRLTDHSVEISKRRKIEEPVTAALWSRHAEKTVKLAMLFACSRATGHFVPTIQLEDVEIAIKLNNWLTRKVLQQADRHVSTSPFHQQVNEMRSLLRSRPGEWTLTEITRKSQGINPKTRQDVLATLVLGGCVVQRERETAGRKATTFRINE